MNSTTNRTATHSLIRSCREEAFYFYLLVTIHTLTFLANFVSAFAIWRLPGLAKNKYHLVVKTLIVGDCLIPLVSLPVPTYSFISCSWFGGKLSCTLSAFFSTAFRSWSAFIVMGMCLMRFLAVNKPLFYRNYVTLPRIKKALLMAFIWGSSHLILPLSGLGKFRIHERGFYCALDVEARRSKDKILVYMTIAEGCVLILAMLYFSTGVHVVVKKKRRVSSTLSAQQQRGACVSNIAKREQGFAKITMVIVLIYCICYSPFLIYRLLILIRGPSEYNHYTYYYTDLVAHLNPLLNPMVYVACSGQYRDSLKRLVTRCGFGRLSRLFYKYVTSDSYGMARVNLRSMSELSARSEQVTCITG